MILLRDNNQRTDMTVNNFVFNALVANSRVGSNFSLECM